VSQLPPPLRDHNLQKLLFITQYEALAACAELRSARLSGGGTCLPLCFHSIDKDSGKLSWAFKYALDSDSDVIEPDSEYFTDGKGFEWALFKWLLVEVQPRGVVPAQVTFPDMAYYNASALAADDVQQATFAAIVDVTLDLVSKQTLVHLKRKKGTNSPFCTMCFAVCLCFLWFFLTLF
jgi:hypothetical protein